MHKVAATLLIEGRLLEAILKAERIGGFGIAYAVPQETSGGRRRRNPAAGRCGACGRASQARTRAAAGVPPGWPLRAACEELADDRYSRRKRGPPPRQERRSGAPKGERPSPRARRRKAAVNAPFGALLPSYFGEGAME
jgi:hypothetical protein